MTPDSAPARKRAVPEAVAHYLVGLTLVFKGIDKAAHFDAHPFTVLFVLLAGAFIILGAVFHRPIARRLPNFAALFHVAEGFSLLLIGFMLLEESSRLPYFLIFIGACYLGIGAFEFFTEPGARRRLRPVLLLVLAAAFLAAAATAIVLNLRGSGNAWVYITAGILVVMAAFMIFVRRRRP